MSVGTPSVRIAVKSLVVGSDESMRGDNVVFVLDGEGLLVEAGFFWDEDYGAVEPEDFILQSVSR